MLALRKVLALRQRKKCRLHLCRAVPPGSVGGQGFSPLILPGVHQYGELAFCVGGIMRIVSHEETFVLHPGDAVLVEPQAWHYETYARPSGAYQSLWLTMASLPGVICATYRKGVLGIDASRPLPGLECTLLLRQIRDELCRRELHWQRKAELLLGGLLIEADRLLHQRGQPRADLRLEPIQRLAHIVKTRFREPLQLHELAREVGVSPDHLSRRFRAHYGVTFRQYLASTRIHHARHLLGQGGTIKETAEAAGFGDVYYFSKVFKEYCRTTPGRFLRSFQKSDGTEDLPKSKLETS